MRESIAATRALRTASFLADTWWFGLSRRVSDDAYRSLAALRASQNFSAVQLVMGVPPEVGPEDPNGQGPTGAAWSAADGAINASYLEHARHRIDVLLDHG